MRHESHDRRLFWYFCCLKTSFADEVFRYTSCCVCRTTKWSVTNCAHTPIIGAKNAAQRTPKGNSLNMKYFMQHQRETPSFKETYHIWRFKPSRCGCWISHQESFGLYCVLWRSNSSTSIDEFENSMFKLFIYKYTVQCTCTLETHTCTCLHITQRIHEIHARYRNFPPHWRISILTVGHPKKRFFLENAFFYGTLYKFNEIITTYLLRYKFRYW